MDALTNLHTVADGHIYKHACSNRYVYTHRDRATSPTDCDIHTDSGIDSLPNPAFPRALIPDSKTLEI